MLARSPASALAQTTPSSEKKGIVADANRRLAPPSAAAMQQEPGPGPGPAAPLSSSSSSSMTSTTTTTNGSGLPDTRTPRVGILSLPPELIDNVFSHLYAYDLAAAGATCVTLRKHAFADMHWHRCVQDNVPGVKVVSPGPCTNYRHLFLLHDRLWFLPRFKVWFCDRDLAGKLIIARYDPRRGCIEAYQLVAVSNHHHHHLPVAQPTVNPAWMALLMSASARAGSTAAVLSHAAPGSGSVTGFEPRVRLHLDKPVLQFRGRAQDGQVDEFCHAKRPLPNRYADEIPMALEDRLVGMFSNFLLTRPLAPQEAARRISAKSPHDNVWPPPAIPAPHRVAGARPGQSSVALSLLDRPVRRSQVSDQTFRIRQWIELAGTPSSPVYMRHGPGLAGTNIYQALDDDDDDDDDNNNDRDHHERQHVDIHDAGVGPSTPPEIGHMGVHIGEEITTYSTLDPALYTPTPERPWRGIWVGDYSGHGCEFLLIHQPDQPPATDEQLGLVRRDWETDADWEERRTTARAFRGRLEAVKLTGDPNVPRGEYTFIAEDMGPGGHIGIIDDAPFSGARVIRSKGHIAATGFLRDKYIETRLILIGHNTLALFWVEFGHISFFERVNIDDFLAP